MADRDDGAVADLVEPSGDASGEFVIVFAVGGTEIPFELGELLAHQRADLAAIAPVPRAERDLAQPLVETHLRAVAEALGDDLGGAPRPADRAGDDRGGARLAQRAQAMPDRFRLRNATGGQRRVAPSLVAPREVPFGLAVPDEEDRH